MLFAFVYVDAFRHFFDIAFKSVFKLNHIIDPYSVYISLFAVFFEHVVDLFDFFGYFQQFLLAAFVHQIGQVRDIIRATGVLLEVALLRAGEVQFR